MRQAARLALALGALTATNVARAQEPAEDDALAPSTVEDANKLSPTKPPPEPAAKPVEKPSAQSADAPKAPPTADERSSKDKPADANAPRTANNAIFVELGGLGLIYSINYERILADGKVGFRIGAAYYPVDDGGAVIPLQLNYYGVGGRSHKLQLGIGMTALIGDGFKHTPLGLSAAIGYRYLPADGGFNFFIGFEPTFVVAESGHTTDTPVLPLPGLQLGGVL